MTIEYVIIYNNLLIIRESMKKCGIIIINVLLCTLKGIVNILNRLISLLNKTLVKLET